MKRRSSKRGRRSPRARRAALAAVAALVAAVAPASPAARAEAVRFRTVIVRDPQTGGGEAFRYLEPVGWRHEGGVVWHHDRSNLATTAMRIWNPAGGEALESFPLMPHVWTQGGIAFFPPGSNYLGNEVRAPVSDPRAYVEQWVVPRHRRGVRNLRVLGATRLEAVEKAVAAAVREPGVDKTIRAARVRLEYAEGGTDYEEDIYCVLVLSTSTMLPGTTIWGPERLYGFRAARGKLAAATPMLQAIVSSVRVHPLWFSKYLQVLQMWRANQMQAIRSAGELSRYIARTNEEISDMVRQSYERRQAANDRVFRNFSRYVRGVEEYRNPFEQRSVALPSGYRDAWVSASGEYLLSNDAGFDPNVGSTIEWRRMNPER